MHLRHSRTCAAVTALALTTPTLLALSVAPAMAGTGGGTLACKTTNLAPTQDAPFAVNVTASPSGPKAPHGATIPVTNATVTVTMSGASVGGIRAQAGNVTAIGINQGIIRLDATSASGSLQVTNLSAPPVSVTNYVPDPDGAGPGVATADPITFTMTNVDFGSVTTNGAAGQSVTISMASDSSGDGFILAIPGGLIPTIGFGSLNSGLGGPGGGGSCFNDTTGALGLPWAPSIASVALVQPPPAKRTFKNTAKPKVVGAVKVGKTLTCKPGSWSPRPTATAFQWLRDGKAVKKAVKAKYRIVKVDARHRLSCTVTVTAPGYTPAKATSARTKTVPKPKRHSRS